ncbi:MAG: hypothetical protein HON23_07190 [Rickettsiales bacterium]|jgi:cytoskeletal protein RodZ|nr:hypothetical protein [Rickettsiales bacterium]
MYDFDAIQRIVNILKQARIDKNISIIEVHKATNIATCRLEQIESCDKEFYLDNKMLFIRYCRTYQEFLEIEDNEDFDRIRENCIAIKDREIVDDEASKRPSMDNLELAMILAVFCWAFVFFVNSKNEKAVIAQIEDDKIIYFEELGK